MQQNRSSGLVLIQTALGPLGLAWTDRGVDRVQLPDGDAANTLERLIQHAPDRRQGTRLPAFLRHVGRRMTCHLDGRPDALLDVPIDLNGCSAFSRTIYKTLRRVAPGCTVTYGELAARAGRPGCSRAVGRAMATNPLPLLVPCHRVLSAGQRLTGFSAPGGVDTKARLLFLEGVILDPAHADGIAHLRRVDRVLRPVIQRVGPYRPRYGEPGDAYGALVEAIVYQQLSLKAAATIAGRVKALGTGNRYPRPAALSRLDDATLRAAGLSRQKIGYLRDLAAHVDRGQLDMERLPRLDDEEVIARITQVKGLGRWSAQMFLLFHLGRLDVLPVADLGFQKGVQTLYGLPDPPDRAALERIGEPWRPYRSMGTWYVWEHANQGGLP